MVSRENKEAIFRTFQKNNPSPETELIFKDRFQLLIAVMLSAQATDISVNLATPKLFEAAPNPEKMIKLGEEGVKKYIRTIGLFNTKAKNIIKTCQILEEKYAGQIPETREELEQLPGVGIKTAGVVMNVAYGALTLPVDTHVFRVSNRIGLVKTKTEKETEKKLIQSLPEWTLTHAHHWLILHGRYVCKARKPLCEKCAIFDYCKYPEKSTIESIPTNTSNKKKKS